MDQGVRPATTSSPSQRRLDEDHADPRRPRELGQRRHLAELTAKRIVDLITTCQGRRRRAVMHGASATTTRLHGRGRHRIQGARAARSRTLARHRRDRRRERASRARSAARCARMSMSLNDTVIGRRQPVRRVGRAGSRRSDALRAVPLAGRPRLPDRDYYLDPSPRMADIRRSTWRTSSRCSALAAFADAAGKAARIVALETVHRRGARARASRPRTSSRRGQPLVARRFRGQGARARLERRSSPPRGSTSRPDVRRLAAARVHRASPLVALDAARDVEGLSRRSTRSSIARRCLPKRVRRRAFRVLRQDAQRHAAAAAALEARRRRHRAMPSARRSASSTSTKYFPPSKKRAPKRWSRTCSPRSGARIDSSTGWRRRPRRRRRRSSRLEGRRRLSRHVARLLGARGRPRRRVWQLRARGAVRLPSHSRSSGSRSTAASG